jgi:hypothetical protein
MSERICLTDDEAAALRDILAALSVIGERGFDDERQMVEMSYQLWREMLLRPAARLVRVTSRERLAGPRR